MNSVTCRPGLVKLLHIAYRIREAYHVRRSDYCRAVEHRSRFYTELWHDAASQLEAVVEPLGNEILEIRLGGNCTRVQQNTTAMDSGITMAVAQNKPVVHRLLAQRHLRTPVYCEFKVNEIAKAAAFVERAGCKCVVKPTTGGGGRGVTTGITRSLDLARAVANARIYSTSLMIEQQVPGDLYRLLYFEGELMDAVLRKPTTVIGDGKSTIRELVRRENETRVKIGPTLAHALITIDTDVRNTLSHQRLTLSSVPKQGLEVTLKTVINDNSQHDNVAAKHLVCRSIIDDGAAAAEAVGVRLAGIDIITPDPTVSLAESGGVILEVNTTPSFHQHYYKRDGNYPVAVHLLPNLLANDVAKRHTVFA